MMTRTERIVTLGFAAGLRHPGAGRKSGAMKAWVDGVPFEEAARGDGCPTFR